MFAHDLKKVHKLQFVGQLSYVLQLCIAIQKFRDYMYTVPLL